MIFILILAIIFFAIAVFLGKELLKKFVFMRDFIQSSNQMVAWKYLGDRRSWMYNIVLRGKTPFCALVGFRLNILIFKYSGFDHYGFIKSNENNVAVISTYLSKSECEFQFLINTDIAINPIVATSSEEDQLIEADSKYPSHWWQRVGFFD